MVVVSLVAIVASLTVTSRSSSSAITVTRTLVGGDFHSSDANVGLELWPNSGGGVFPMRIDERHALDNPHYVEAGLDVPVGATITNVTIYYRHCGLPVPTTSVGSYSPAARTLA